MAATNYYELIKTKIEYLKANRDFSCLRDKKDDYAFTALCVQADYYTSPALSFSNERARTRLVDGTNDGGVDALFNDPNSEESDLVLVQSKFYQKITFEDVVNAFEKMLRFYDERNMGHYESVKQEISNRFATLRAETGEESKIVFVLYTSAPKNNLKKDKIERELKTQLDQIGNAEIRILFDNDIYEKIKEFESRQPDVATGKIFIDESGNYLSYGDEEAIIANVSARSIKSLYTTHSFNLLAKNLRYHVAGKTIDCAIRDSIRDNPHDFWFKNNGITIICESYRISGNQITLSHFSIINGGQTTYILYSSPYLHEGSDFYLPCKIIIAQGNDEDEKARFVLDIAKATNSQKAIKAIDLKANSPEQVRFGRIRRNNGIFYQTKRGEKIPKDYKEPYKNTDLSDIGKLCLSAIFQLPCSSRNKPSIIFNQEFYEPIFNGNQDKIAKISRELLYRDDYFRNGFLKKFDKEMESNPTGQGLIRFGHNARTICIAYAAFAARVWSGNFDNEKLRTLFANFNEKEGIYKDVLYGIFKDIDSVDTLFSKELFDNKDRFDDFLFKLYKEIIVQGSRCFYYASQNAATVMNETNYLKNDYNYYSILKASWNRLTFTDVFKEYEQ